MLQIEDYSTERERLSSVAQALQAADKNDGDGDGNGVD